MATVRRDPNKISTTCVSRKSNTATTLTARRRRRATTRTLHMFVLSISLTLATLHPPRACPSPSNQNVSPRRIPPPLRCKCGPQEGHGAYVQRARGDCHHRDAAPRRRYGAPRPLCYGTMREGGGSFKLTRELSASSTLSLTAHVNLTSYGHIPSTLLAPPPPPFSLLPMHCRLVRRSPLIILARSCRLGQRWHGLVCAMFQDGYTTFTQR